MPAHAPRPRPQRPRAALSDGSSLRPAPGTARRTPARRRTLRQPSIPPPQASIGGFGLRVVAPSFEGRIGGTVLGSDGGAIEGVYVYALVRIEGEAWEAGRGKTGPEGDFEFVAPGSGYTLGVWIQCPRDDIVQWVYGGEWARGPGSSPTATGSWRREASEQGRSRMASETAPAWSSSFPRRGNRSSRNTASREG